MAFSRKQMVAIIMKLKSKGLLGRLLGKGTQAIPSVGHLSRTQLKFGNKRIPLALSPKVAKASWGKHFSGSAIRSYLGKALPKHVQESTLKGIYALDNHEFNRMMGGVLRRTHTPEEITGFRVALKTPDMDIFNLFAPAQKNRIMGIQQNGRIFLNAEAITQQADALKVVSPQYRLNTQNQVRKAIVRHVTLHEFGHHVDNPGIRFMAASKGEAAIAAIKTKSTSPDNKFFEAVTGSSDVAHASMEERIYAIEAFPDLYSTYAQHPFLLKLTNRRGYDAIKPFFEGK